VTRDPALAGRLLLDAIRLLEGTSQLMTEPRWTSAVGRALRDYADLLAGQPERLAEGARNGLTWALGRIRARDFEGVLASLHGWTR